MTDLTTYLVTGANRGIGRGLVSSLLLRPHTVLIAAVRDPEAPTSQSLTTLSRDPESRLIVVKIDSLSRQDPQFAMADLTSNHGILHLDVVIANAGVNTSMAPVLETMPEEMREILEVNTLAPLLLFQAAWPLLQKSKSPKLVVMSSDMASIGRMNPNPGLAYGVSKAALDYVVKKIRVEHESVTAVALHPGWVQTDMGNHSAKLWGVDRPPVTLKDSVDGCLKQIDTVTRDGCDEGILVYDGSGIPW